MDAAEAPPPATSDGPWQGYRRVVTHHLVVVDGRTYMVEETSFEPESDDVEEERLSRLMLPYLTSRPDSPESNRSVNGARVAASSDAILGLQDAGIRMPAECAVCLQDFVAEDRLRAMPCSHTFHRQVQVTV